MADVANNVKFNVKNKKKRHRLSQEKTYLDFHWQANNKPESIINAKTFLLRRVLWTLATSICLFICINQIAERIIFFLEKPVAVNVHIENIESPPIPYITVCSTLYSLRGRSLLNNPPISSDGRLNINRKFLRIISASPEFKNVWQNSECVFHSQLNMTTANIWNYRRLKKSNFHFDKVIGSNNKEKIGFIMQEFFDESGPCYVLQPNITLKYVKNTEIMLCIINNFPISNMYGKYYIIIHHDRFPLIPEMQKKSKIYSSHVFRTSLQITQFINLNFTKNPCVSSEVYVNCRQDCLKTILSSSNISCKFPITIDNHVTRSNCSTFEMCTAGLLALRRTLAYHNPTICNCPRKCENVVYEVTTTKFGRVEDSKVIDKYGSKFSEVIITIPLSYTKIEEYISYNIVALFCDFGGSLGLCMGLCLISMLEIIQTIILSLKKRIKK